METVLIWIYLSLVVLAMSWPICRVFSTLSGSASNMSEDGYLGWDLAIVGILSAIFWPIILLI